MAPQPYNFAPLRDGIIRVLQLERKEQLADPLECTMHTLDLGAEPHLSQAKKLPYATLSYSWGPTFSDNSHLTHSLHCDGNIIPITASLDRGLRRIRAIDPNWWDGFEGHEAYVRRRPPLLWVDQACINQHDLAERNHEVSRMGYIYKRSACLIMWLDEIDDRDGVRVREAITMDPPGQEPKSFLELQWRNSLDHFGLTWGYEMDRTQRMSIYWPFIIRPFFSRRWCIQECVNTLHGQLMLLGGTILRPPEVRYTARLLSLPDMERADAIFSPEKHNLRYLLQECDVAKCTLEQDIVYALLGIAKDAVGYHLRVDYSRPFDDVCRDIVRGALHPRNGFPACVFQLIVLAASRCGRLTSSKSNLPTWIPDWRIKASYTCEEHRSITQTFAYLDYQVPPDHMYIEGNYAYLKGELIKPCFPRHHDFSDIDTPDYCQCCAYWKSEYQGWTDELQTTLCDATARGLILFTPSFQRIERLRTLFGQKRITLILSKASDPEQRNQRQTYRLESCFDSSIRSDPQYCDESEATWICLT